MEKKKRQEGWVQSSKPYMQVFFLWAHSIGRRLLSVKWNQSHPAWEFLKNTGFDFFCQRREKKLEKKKTSAWSWTRQSAARSARWGESRGKKRIKASRVRRAGSGAARKPWLKPHGVTEGSLEVIDRVLSAVVNILKIRSIKSAGCRSAPPLVGAGWGKAKGSPAV